MMEIREGKSLSRLTDILGGIAERIEREALGLPIPIARSIVRDVKQAPPPRDTPGRRRQVPESWQKIRKRIYTRDDGFCWGCGRRLLWNQYECGHLTSRVFGGSDEDANLAVMCHECNRSHISLHPAEPQSSR